MNFHAHPFVSSLIFLTGRTDGRPDKRTDMTEVKVTARKMPCERARELALLLNFCWKFFFRIYYVETPTKPRTRS